MLRRLHTRIIGMGSVCGLAPSPPAEVFLKTLPPPSDVDAAKYARFQREEEERTTRRTQATSLTPSHRGACAAPEPFYDVVAAAAGHKHVAMLTREGNLISVGNNRYGQTGAQSSDSAEDKLPSHGRGPQRGHPTHARGSTVVAGLDPLYIDLDGAFPQTNPAVATRVCCGSNFTLLYQSGGRRVIAFGNNHMGQLGAGHKHRVDGVRGFTEWDPSAAWWPAERVCVLQRLECGFNHVVAQMNDGALYAFGSNNWGELGIGNTDAPMCPTRIGFFEQRGLRVAKVALGNSFTLFLTQEGRVYGCGATNGGQLPPNTFDPVPIPLTRSFQKHTDAATSGTAVSVDGVPKLIRIKDVACVGTLAVFVSTKNELLIQGSLPEYGVTIPSPRFAEVDQTPALRHFRACVGAPVKPDDFDIVRLIGGPSTLLVRYRNGCVAGLGANTEGQLHNVTKVLNGKPINLAPAFKVKELIPVLIPSAAPWESAWFVSGKGFNLLFDHHEAYSVPESAPPIELPPGSGNVCQVAHTRQSRLRASFQ
jgi:alpha-tubulin suppressor-like RCC1 family protein